MPTPASDIPLFFWAASQMLEALNARQVSPRELLQAHIQRIEAVNPNINALVTSTLESALEQAAGAERRLMRGEARPLEGLPVTVKDTFDVAGVRSTSGTKLREHYIPRTDAAAVAALRRAGAILLGKTNVPECAFDIRTESAIFGRTCNPWNAQRAAGGSSGGEAAAIAAGCSAAGIGSDMGGSIRIPAHFCGICGFKPTPGRVPAAGHFPDTAGIASLITSVGPMARSVTDLKILFRVLAGFDPGDPASVPLPVRELPESEARSLAIMWYPDYADVPVTAAVRAAVERSATALQRAGFKVVERRPAGIEKAFDLWSTWMAHFITPRVLAMFEGREERMGPLLSAVRRGGLPPPSLDAFAAAWIARDALRASVLKEMEEFPIILAPVGSVPAFPHSHRGRFDVDGRPVDYLRAFSFSIAFNLLGFPSVVIPCGRSEEGLPIGVQVVARAYHDEHALAVAGLLEREIGPAATLNF